VFQTGLYTATAQNQRAQHNHTNQNNYAFHDAYYKKLCPSCQFLKKDFTHKTEIWYNVDEPRGNPGSGLS